MPARFPTYPETAIASYDYVDIASGTGLVNLYPIVGQDSTGNTYDIVKDTAMRAAVIETSRVNSSGTTTLTFDLAAFNKPRHIEGTAYAVIPFYEIGNSSAAYVTIKLQHYDGTTATDLTATVQSVSLSEAAGEYLSLFLKLPITTEAHFSRGEILRAVVTLTTGASITARVGHDPSNQTSPSTDLDNTQLIISVPFRIQSH